MAQASKPLDLEDRDGVHEVVRDAYGKIAEANGVASCCGSQAAVAQEIGYTQDDLAAVPEGANLGVGCGNPLAFAEPKAGEVVLDLGSGAGFDSFLAARAVGAAGRVIGVDMTEEMLELARENARKTGLDNVEFRKGVIEHLPVDDESVDIVISNCVINLATDKEQVFREVRRVLRPGGRMVVSDLVLEKPLPAAVAKSAEAYIGCIAGAMLRPDYVAAIERAGLREVEVVESRSYGDILIGMQMPELQEAAKAAGLSDEQVQDAASSVTSVKVAARR
jgi:SAM-dependent methyltransferase